MLLSVSNVHKAFSTDVVLDGVDFRIDPREKVALVGRNGAGKTTLLKILTGQMEPDMGFVQLQRGAKVGYLRQEAQVGSGKTVLEEAEEARRRQLEMKGRLDELQIRLEHGNPTQEDLDEFALLHEHFLETEGFSAERDLQVVLKQMGFEDTDLSKPTSALSGGEKTRLAIARLLLEEPDLLILDEPTNHLDLQATEWLESWIRQYHGAVLLVSHDRAFLETTSERVLEMREGRVKAYPGPFTKFLQLREEEDARQAEVARRQDIEIAKMDEYVRRFMNSQRTAQARGRLKLMNRLVANKVDAPTDDRGMKAGFGEAKRSGDLVVTAEKLTIGFPGELLIKEFNWTVRFGERWGIIGENGAGKSTLIKVAMGNLDPVSGRVRLGSNVVAGYFTQDGSDLDPEQSPLDTLVYDDDLKPAEARNLLARFLLTGDDVYRPVKTLSGGEKNKLSLARLTNLNPNLLVLDEPTNHLDMASREALAGVLRDYKGTLLLISHDRWLLSQIADHVLDVRRAGSIVYEGSFDDYRRGKKGVTATPAKKESPTIPKLLDGKSKPPEPELSPRELSKEIERCQKLVNRLEEDVANLEGDIKEIEEKLANLPPTADVFALSREYQVTKEELEGAMSTWEEQAANLERLIARRNSTGN